MEIQRELNESTYEWREQYKQTHIDVVERTPQKKRRFSLGVDCKKGGETSETSMTNSSSSSDVGKAYYYLLFILFFKLTVN